MRPIHRGLRFLLGAVIWVAGVMPFPRIQDQVFAMRCGGRVISTGDTAYEVLAKCGPPDYVEKHFEERLVPAWERWYLFKSSPMYLPQPWVVEHIMVEKWTYNFGPHELIYHLKFYDGILEEINTGDRGF